MTLQPRRSVLDHRLIVVTGKGGTGKTTVSALLGLAAVGSGKKVLIAEVGPEEHVSGLLDPGGPQVGYAGRELRPGLFAMRVDPYDALAEYLGMQLGGRALLELGLSRPAMRQFLDGAPGWRELVTLGKVWHLGEQRENGAPLYDLIIIDAPATGHGVTFLDVPRVVRSAAHAGPLARNAGRIEEMLRDPAHTLLLPVSLAEELPTSETVELVARMREALGMNVDRVVMNAVAEAPFGADKADLPTRLRGLPAHPDAYPSPDFLAHCAEHLHSRHTLNRFYVHELASRTRLPIVTLPLISEGLRSPGALERLSRALMMEPVAPADAGPASLEPVDETPASQPGVMPPAAAACVDLAALTRDRRVLVCMGTGGVGKTTISAAIALAAARGGKRALVLTIDPARRLADALDIGRLGNTPRRVPDSRAHTLGITQAGGSLSAMMLDMKRTFDDLVRRFASDESMRERVLANPIYQHVSDALAGSGEYAAMEKLYEMTFSGQFDLIVLDTPPSQHGIDFLDAPQRLLDFIDSRAMKVLIHPAFSAGRLGLRLFQGATRRAFTLLEKVTGIDFLNDISEFLLIFEDMSSGFAERARHVAQLMRGPAAGFLLVAGPSPEAARHGRSMLAHLDRHQVHLLGLIANRMRLWPGDRPDDDALEAADEDALASALGPPGAPDHATARAALRAARAYARIAALDRESTAPLREAAGQRGLFFQPLPELPRDVHDLDGLDQIARLLFEAPRAALETEATHSGEAHDARRDRSIG